MTCITLPVSFTGAEADCRAYSEQCVEDDYPVFCTLTFGKVGTDMKGWNLMC